MAAADVGFAEVRRRLNILLIAYEFPPSPSPQSLRWAYLVRELALLGHRIHVLAPEHPGSGEGMPVLPADVMIHRTFAGPAMGLLNALARRGRRRTRNMDAAGGSSAHGSRHPAEKIASEGAPTRLNWKGHLHNAFNHYRTLVFHAVQRWTSTWFFPDGRAEWYPWAKRRLIHILDEVDVDLVISSHEPATTLTLGLAAHRKGYPWIADLGDPVLAPYTSPKWRERARRLEGEVCVTADQVTVTTAALARLLEQRHGVADGKLAVLTQGFDARTPLVHGVAEDAGSPQLELLYTGSLYSFRRIGPLLEAVLKTSGIRLSIASISVPEEVRLASERSSSIRLLGFLSHGDAVERQSRCDVLVNLANDDPCQVPGKFYEYLGAGRPILHIGDGKDAAADLLREVPRGWVCQAESGALGVMLRELKAKALAGKLADSLDLSEQAVRNHGWTAIAAHLDEMMNSLLAERGK